MTPNATAARQDLAIAQGQLRDYQARLGAPFPHDAYLTELTGLRDQLKAALSSTTPEPAAKPLPPAHELAERIKALKAAHTIEAAPQRLTARSAARAEEPVTARIRHRVKESPAFTRRRIRLFPQQQHSRHLARLRLHRRSLGFSRSGVRLHPPSPEPSTRSTSLRISARPNARCGSSNGHSLSREYAGQGV